MKTQTFVKEDFGFMVGGGMVVGLVMMGVGALVSGPVAVLATVGVTLGGALGYKTGRAELCQENGTGQRLRGRGHSLFRHKSLQREFRTNAMSSRPSTAEFQALLLRARKIDQELSVVDENGVSLPDAIHYHIPQKSRPTLTITSRGTVV